MSGPSGDPGVIDSVLWSSLYENIKLDLNLIDYSLSPVRLYANTNAHNTEVTKSENIMCIVAKHLNLIRRVKTCDF